MIKYEKYWLSRIISVQAVVSADYVVGRFPAANDHSHQDAWELIYVCAGSATVRKDRKSVLLEQDQMILLCPGIRHDLQIEDPNTKAFVLSFVCSNDNYLLSVQNQALRAEPAMLTMVESMIRELTATFSPQNPRLHLIRFVPDENSPVGAEQMICCYLEQFLILLLRKTANTTSTLQFHKVFQTYLSDQVTEYIRQNLSHALTVQQIAEHFHYSRARLSALYKEATGTGINGAITNIRIQKAKELLKNSGKSIAEISEELGFSSAQYFSYKFAKEVGMPPSRYVEE